MSLKAYTKEWLEELCAESISYAEVLKKAGRKQGGGNQATLKRKIEEFGIDISHFKGMGWSKGLTKETDDRLAQHAASRQQYTFEEVFKKDSVISQKGLRGYMQRYQPIPYQCSICGCDGHWQDGIISLELHHKDGDNHNNEIENLEYRCPNCHALTETYRGKNKALKNCSE